VKNASWDTAYPESDYVIKVQTEGVYDVTFTFDTSTRSVGCNTSIVSAGAALFLRGNMIETAGQSSWNYDYQQYRFDDGSLTLDASNINSDIEFKFKWSDGGWGGVSEGVIASNGIITDHSFGYDNSYGNIVLSQSTLKCDHYVITVNTNNNTFSVQGYKKVATNGSGYCTLTTNVPLTISGGATAYYATDDKGNGSATAHAMTNPAANVPMLIKGSTSTTYSFAVAASGTDNPGNTNAFKAGTGSALASTTDGKYNYILNGNAFYAANGKTVALGKAYLQLSTAASARALVFADDEATSIEAVDNMPFANDHSVYNLNGQRVNTPQKGLYIVNGRKVVLK
jgi:hypothetical protein